MDSSFTSADAPMTQMGREEGYPLGEARVVTDAPPSTVRTESGHHAQRTAISASKSGAESDVDMEIASQGTPSDISSCLDSSDDEQLFSHRTKSEPKTHRSTSRAAEPMPHLWTPQSLFSPGSSSYAQRTSERPKKCCVCKEKPAHSRYPTCGLTCAAKLQEQESTHRYGMCKVCGERPKAYDSSGKRYETCGFKCSSKLKEQEIESRGRCEQCGEQPKARRGGSLSPYCGPCDGRARYRKPSKPRALVVRGNCNTCLVCWTGQITDQLSVFCSSSCVDSATNLSPTLVEIPRGHTYFYRVSDEFERAWDASQQDCPTIHHIYCAIMPQNTRDRYDEYKNHWEKYAKGPKEIKTWVGFNKFCNIGDSGLVHICSYHNCTLCNVLQNGIISDLHPTGVRTSTKSSSANLGGGQGTSKAIFQVNTLVPDKDVVEMSREQLLAPRNGAKQHRDAFVRIVTHGKHGRNEDTGDLHVSVNEAMLPQYLVIYS
ncbi:hypothetical protein FA15DRAFT_673470 [Coprinopsis marcescibilis]|uniref:Uncharacterized protein n=1 Tax=Coprinopsis marcescibilis TaxID=230819 RepID=A0A5C3KJH9_COPMA|nr:hypothetical protein FA15DRAFT_673470 [Coprinopsis marcescibilis]